MIRVAPRATRLPSPNRGPTATIPRLNTPQPRYTQPTCQKIYGDFVSKRFTHCAVFGSVRNQDAT